MSSVAHTAPFILGQWQITPLTNPVPPGRFQAVLSVRRGQGMQSHDRVYTFKPVFDSRDSALMYAVAQGRYWPINPMAV